MTFSEREKVMDHRDEELSDVVVVLSDDPALNVAEAVNSLKSAGLSVSDIDEADRVVEGTIASEKAKGLEKLPNVKYVRNVFTYTADFPTGDSRNCDPDNDECEPDVDDAGA